MKQRRNFYLAEIYFLLAALTVVSIPAISKAEVKVFTLDKDTTIAASGEVTFRNTYENWFQPVQTNVNNDSDYIFTRTRLAIALRNRYIGAFVQAQDVHMWNLPERSIAASPEGLATLLDFSPSYMFSRNFMASLYCGHAFGRDVIKSIYKKNSNGDLLFVELKGQF